MRGANKSAWEYQKIVQDQKYTEGYTQVLGKNTGNEPREGSKDDHEETEGRKTPCSKREMRKKFSGV